MPFFTPKVERECGVPLHFKSGVPLQVEISMGLGVWDLKVEGKWQFRGHFEGQSGGKEGRRGGFGGPDTHPNLTFPQAYSFSIIFCYLHPTYFLYLTHFFYHAYPTIPHSPYYITPVTLYHKCYFSFFSSQVQIFLHLYNTILLYLSPFSTFIITSSALPSILANNTLKVLVL